MNDGLRKIGEGAFRLCDIALESITLPSTVIKIGNEAFHSCRNLREVTLNDGLQKIGRCTFAFSGCSNLREVKLNGVPQYFHFKSKAFYNCDALERFLFPPISYRLENINQTSHWEDLEEKVNEVRGVVQWESDKLFVSRLTIFHNWNETKRDLGEITRLVSYYELKEATTTIELAMWKFNLNKADATNTTNRAAYRIDVPGPVKDIMLQYLDHI